LNDVRQLLRKLHSNPILLDQLSDNTGLGSDLFTEFQDRGKILSLNFLSWLYIEENGLSVIDHLCQSFNRVEILEHYNDYFKLRVPRSNTKSIGTLFGLIESLKSRFSISEYSVS
jgi:hypothetical protein